MTDRPHDDEIPPRRGAAEDHTGTESVPVVLEIPAQGTGARAARRAARLRAETEAQPETRDIDIDADARETDARDTDADRTGADPPPAELYGGRPLVAPARPGRPADVAAPDAEGAAPEETPADDPPPAATPVARQVSKPPPPPRWRSVAFAVTLVALLASGLGLAYAGVRTVRDSTEGKVLDITTDPEAPGFEAVVSPTPTLLLVQEEDDEAVALTFLALGPGDVGGAVIVLPLRTISDIPVFGPQPIAYAYDGGGIEPATETVQDLLGVGVHESIEVSAPRWTSLVEPVAPIEIDNPDEIILVDDATGSRGRLFASGPIELEADEVGAYLAATSEGETDLARLERHHIFWRAWLDAIAASDRSDVVPGEATIGLGRFARGLAAGPVRIETLPVGSEISDFDKFGNGYPTLDAQIEQLVTDAVALPVTPRPGVRPRVRLLNGTLETDVLNEVAPILVDAGAEIALFGNAGTRSESETTLVYTGAEFRDEVERMAAALGVGRVVRDDRPSEVVDVTVVLGTDYFGGSTGG